MALYKQSPVGFTQIPTKFYGPTSKENAVYVCISEVKSNRLHCKYVKELDEESESESRTGDTSL